jgi:hypothetical protein
VRVEEEPVIRTTAAVLFQTLPQEACGGAVGEGLEAVEGR